MTKAVEEACACGTIGESAGAGWTCDDLRVLVGPGVTGAAGMSDRDMLSSSLSISSSVDPGSCAGVGADVAGRDGPACVGMSP